MRKLDESLSALLKKTKKSNAELAKDLGVSQATVGNWLAGRDQPGRPNLAKIVLKYGPTDRSAKKRCLAQLFVLQEEARTEKDEEEKHWAPDAKELALETLAFVRSRLKSVKVSKKKGAGRTLVDFPGAFDPMVVVTGDKREESDTRINVGDFGAVSASPAETRWILKLGLSEDTECFGDKVFVLEDVEQLRRRFGRKNLLVVGSPGSNHFARRCLLRQPLPGWRASMPLFSFNFRQDRLWDIENFLEGLSDKNLRQLVGIQADPKTKTDLKNWLHSLFGGGIIDPSNRGYWVSGEDLRSGVDFGMVSVGRNPFAEDDEYVCIFAAGFHMFGTAHAVGMLCDRGNFEKHPLGGIIKVTIDVGQPFCQRFDNTEGVWDREPQSCYEISELLAELEREDRPTHVDFSDDYISELTSFIRVFAGVK